MNKIFSKMFVTLAMIFVPFIIGAGSAYAAPSTTPAPGPACIQNTTAQGQVLGGINQTGASCSTSGVDSLIVSIVKIISYAVGVVAVIMIVYAGFLYITSGGDSGKITKAKNALIYAIIGLFIASLAQFIVHFVLTTAQGV